MPCAVATSWTPRSAIVLAAFASGSLPISSMMMDFRHVILHRLDHHAVLEGGGRHLHAPRASDGGMRDVAVPRDFVRSVHHDDAAERGVRQNAGDFPQHRSLAHARLAQKQNALARHYQVFDDPNRAIDGAPDPQRQAYYLPAAVAYRGYAVERPLDSGAVVLSEIAYALYGVANLIRRHLRRIERDAAVAKPRFRLPAQVHHDLKQPLRPAAVPQGIPQARGKLVYENFQIPVYVVTQAQNS